MTSIVAAMQDSLLLLESSKRGWLVIPIYVLTLYIVQLEYLMRFPEENAILMLDDEFDIRISSH
jgi:hypothetical protein